jgi:hypothetical protein
LDKQHFLQYDPSIVYSLCIRSPVPGPGSSCCLFTTVLVHGQKLTGPWSTMCEDILIIRFRGTSFTLTRFRICASRVGIQCCVSGVALHILKIFCKCSRLCRSPLSCHLKNLCGLINVTIASTQRGPVIACSLRCSASWTFLNL